MLFASLQRSMIYAARPGPVHADPQWVESGRLKPVAIARQDGGVLNGWWTKAVASPASKNSSNGSTDTAESKGLVILFPGNAGDRSGRIPILDDFNRCGWDALIFDYRGYADNPGTPSESAFASDARTIWDFATGTLGYSAGKIVLAGQSLGGGVATRLAWDLKQEGISPAGLILRATFTSLPDVGSRLYPWLPVRWLMIDRYPSIDRIGELTCPILIIHGRLDTITPLSHGEALFAAAPERSTSGVPKTFIEIPNCGHNDLQLLAAEQLHRAHQTFFSKVLAARSMTHNSTQEANSEERELE